MLVSSGKLLEAAKAGHFAIPSANFVDEDSLRWHLQTAEEMNLPIIIALAEVHLDRLITLEEGAHIAKFYAERTSNPVVLHLDHGKSFETCKKAVDLGFTSVMLDASMESFDVNVQRTREVIEYARAHGVSVEAEIGHVGTGAKYDNNSDNIYTTVEEAAAFVERTGVDSLAVSIGTAHGLYKGTPKINFDRLHELAAAVKAPLVLHGGSSSGDDNLHRCATEGIAKINVYSDLVVAAAKEVYALQQKEAEVEDYYTYKEAAKQGMQAMLKHCFEVFATKPVTL
ncbi:MAG: class II fructose-bisphosphate aldolase [Lachnospiraceae bacterium]|nr:class II fructose-bisphosphate aldolase [Lachnospiraceae bacterium]